EVMPVTDNRADLVRRVECTEGEVVVEQDFVARFDYGDTVPWARRVRTGADEEVLLLIGGPESVALSGPSLVAGDQCHRGEHPLRAGESQAWTLTWHPSYDAVPEPPEPDDALERTRQMWRDWSAQVTPDGPYAELVHRSLLVLRGLTHGRTGGVVAAPTTSLPESSGGVRNWDYRYCWLRDSALTLEAMLEHGLTEGAHHWRDWLLRAVAGDPTDLQR